MGPLAKLRLVPLAVLAAAPAFGQEVPRWHLVGELEGVDARLPRLVTELIVEETTSPLELHFQANGPFGVDLGQRGHGRELPDVVRVRVADPDYEDATFEFVQRVHGDDAVEFHGTMSVVRRPSAHVRGRVVQGDGPSPALVRAFAFGEDGWPLPEPIASDRAGPDGEFLLRVGEPAHCVVVASWNDARPAQVELELSALDFVPDVELVLGRGSTLSGVVRHEDTPAAEGTIVIARRIDWVVCSAAAAITPGALRSETEAGALAWDAGRYENLTSHTTVAAGGGFRFRGLAPGLYDLSILHAVTLDGFRYTWQASEEAHHVVEVPGDELTLLSPLRRLVVRVEVDGRPLDLARLSVLDRASGETVMLSSLVRSSTQKLSGKTMAATTGVAGTLELLVDPDRALDLSIERGGFNGRRIELARETYDGPLVVELTRAHPGTDVQLDLHSNAPLPERVTVDFQGLDVRVSFQRTLEVGDGKLVLRDVPSGEYWIEVAPAPADPDASAPASFHLTEGFKLEVSTGVNNIRRVNLALGGLLRMTATGDKEELVRARLVVRDAEDRVVSHSIGSHEPWRSGEAHTSRTPLPPGRYRLRFMALGHGDWYGFALVRAGEVTAVDVTLVAR